MKERRFSGEMVSAILGVIALDYVTNALGMPPLVSACVAVVVMLVIGAVVAWRLP